MMKPGKQLLVFSCLGPLVIYFAQWIFPLVVQRPQDWFGELDEATKAMVQEAIQVTENKNYNCTIISQEQRQQYLDDGFIVLRSVLTAEQLAALKALYTHIQDHPRFMDAVRSYISCASAVFGADRHLPELSDLFASLYPLHTGVADLMETEDPVLFNSIFHYNTRSCAKEGAVLHTHADFFSLPFNIDRREGPNGFWGDNGAVAWVAVDEISSQAVTMQLAKGSHRRYKGNGTRTRSGTDPQQDQQQKYTQESYCQAFAQDLELEMDPTSELAQSFVELPVLHPGDVAIFSGFTYHRPMPYCKKNCNSRNSRRLTLRYADGKRTYFRTDIPSQAQHPMTRWCPTWPARVLLGKPCRIHPGMMLRDYVETARSQPRQDPWYYYPGSGPLVHHDSCDIKSRYTNKVLRRVLHNYAPKLQEALFGGPPEVRPGEEHFYQHYNMQQQAPTKP